MHVLEWLEKPKIASPTILVTTVYSQIQLCECSHGDYGSPLSIRSEWFLGDCEEPDEKQRKEILIKWLHSAFLTGYNMGRFEGLEAGIEQNES